MKTQKQHALEALKALDETEEKIAKLRAENDRLLEQAQEADGRLGDARWLLDNTAAGPDLDSKALHEARDKVSEAKQKAGEVAEWVESVDRALEKLEAERNERLEAYKAAHSSYWYAREQSELEKASAAADALVAAWVAHRTATGPHNQISIADYVRERAPVFGVTEEAASNLNVEDGVPVARPDEAA